MKNLMLILLMINFGRAGAQTCAAGSPEMSQYFSQKNWKHVSFTDPSGVKPVGGYVDEQNNLRIEDLSRSGSFPVSLTVDPGNTSYADFFKYCRNSSSKGAYLRSMRVNKEGNRYSASLRFLPAITGYANQPFAAQNFTPNTLDVSVKFTESSLISTNERYADQVKADFSKQIRKQIADQKEFGVIELDLTGWDDVVCDLIQGNATIAVNRTATSWNPIIQQMVNVDPQSVQTVYQTLKAQFSGSLPKEKLLFFAGRATAKLEQDRRIIAMSDKTAFDAIKGMLTPDATSVASLDGQALSCLSDSLQGYTRSLISHVIGIQLQFPGLDEISNSSQGAH